VSVILLVAPSGLGKTTACRRVIELARANGLSVAGLLSLPVFEGEVKTAINLHSIATSQERLLARANWPGDGPQVGIWTFEPEVLGWGRNILDSIQECDLLIIDEIGPLEFVEHQGLNNTLDVLRRARAYLSIITLRPSLAEVAREELSEIKVSIQILDEITAKVSLKCF
jgi:nucleoside-triphosphatase